MIHDHAGLYIHIPFCRKKCPYCDFYSIANQSRRAGFLDALYKEINLYKDCIKFPPFDSIYFGGGTPSLLNADTLHDLLQSLLQIFTFSGPDIEITLEANPKDLSIEYLSSLKEIGINRLNIGVQSFDDTILQFLGRRHTGAEALEAFQNARTKGFDNIGIDLIYGIPDQSIAEWPASLKKVLSICAEHISCYQLTIHEKTPFGIRFKKGELAEQDEESLYEFFQKTTDILTEAGYQHYEISNFAKTVSHRSRHNRKYWSHAPYLGLGPAAHSFLPKSQKTKSKRWWNHHSLKEYITDLNRHKLPIAEFEYLDRDALKLESLYLGLRTKEGVDLETFCKEYGQDLRLHPQGVLEMLIRENHATVHNDILRLTPKGQALCDSIATLW